MRWHSFCLCVVALLPACAPVATLQGPGPDAVPPPVQPPLRQTSGGGVFLPETPWSLTSDSRAFRAGDVLTVILEETTQASKKAGTQLDKGSSVSVQPTVFGGKTYETNVGINAQRDFSGNASSTQQNALKGAITVIVQEVLPNGLLRVHGEKSLLLNQGEEIIQVSGYVRASDIDTDNRVSSQRVANARISYAGRGALADANTPGWLARFFLSPLLPF